MKLLSNAPLLRQRSGNFSDHYREIRATLAEWATVVPQTYVSNALNRIAARTVSRLIELLPTATATT